MDRVVFTNPIQHNDHHDHNNHNDVWGQVILSQVGSRRCDGEWVSSLDLKSLLSHHEALAESAAIGVPDDKWGERPLMMVVLRPEARGKADSVSHKKVDTLFAF